MSAQDEVLRTANTNTKRTNPKPWKGGIIANTAD